MSQIEVACEVELTQPKNGLPRGSIGSVEQVAAGHLTGPEYYVRFYELPNGNRLLTPITIWVHDGAVLRA